MQTRSSTKLPPKQVEPTVQQKVQQKDESEDEPGNEPVDENLLQIVPVLKPNSLVEWQEQTGVPLLLTHPRLPRPPRPPRTPKPLTDEEQQRILDYQKQPEVQPEVYMTYEVCAMVCEMLGYCWLLVMIIIGWLLHAQKFPVVPIVAAFMCGCVVMERYVNTKSMKAVWWGVLLSAAFVLCVFVNQMSTPQQLVVSHTDLMSANINIETNLHETHMAINPIMRTVVAQCQQTNFDGFYTLEAAVDAAIYNVISNPAFPVQFNDLLSKSLKSSKSITAFVESLDSVVEGICYIFSARIKVGSAFPDETVIKPKLMARLKETWMAPSNLDHVCENGRSCEVKITNMTSAIYRLVQNNCENAPNTHASEVCNQIVAHFKQNEMQRYKELLIAFAAGGGAAVMAAAAAAVVLYGVPSAVGEGITSTVSVPLTMASTVLKYVPVNTIANLWRWLG